MTQTELKQFLSDRPQLSTYGFAKESGISNSLLKMILSGERSLTKKTITKITPVMIKYGYKNNEL